MKKTISVVLALFGRYAALTNLVQEKIEQIRQLKKKCEVIMVLDGPQWTSVPMLQLLAVNTPWVKVVKLPESSNLPAVLFNAGVREASGDHICFSTLFGADLTVTTELFQRALLQKIPETVEDDQPISYYLCPDTARESDFFLTQALYGQCQTHDCVHIDEWCVPKSLLEGMGGFPETPLLQEEMDRYAALAFLRLSYAHQAAIVPKERMSQPLSRFPFEKRLVKNRDMAKRYAIYCNATALPPRSHEVCVRQFIRDLPENEAREFAELQGLPLVRNEAEKHYRIFIIGGYWEYHHNQLTFFNYLENLYGSGFATFNCGLDMLVQPPELTGYDLVIFTRCRSAQSVKLMRYCKDRQIPTVYMIDDNWFSVAKDYPSHGSIFVPGNPNFDNFIKNLSLCKTTFVYNPVLYHAVLPYTANVQRMPTSVCLQSFQAKNRRERRDDELYVGFFGSLRWNDIAFQALARLARRHKEVKVFLFGTLSPSQELLFKELEALVYPVVNYSEYIKHLTRIQPDLFVAPLDDNVTSASKTANKYLDGGAVGAAGVFSKVEPYLSVIQDGVNGYFAEENTEEGWFRRLEEIISDIPALRETQRRAQEDVRQNFSAVQLLPVFKEKITAVIEQEELTDD